MAYTRRRSSRSRSTVRRSSRARSGYRSRAVRGTSRRRSSAGRGAGSRTIRIEVVGAQPVARPETLGMKAAAAAPRRSSF